MNKTIDTLPRNVYVHLCVLVLLALAVYSNTFDVPFYYDDEVFIVQNPLIKDFSYFKDPSSAEHVSRSVFIKRYFITRYVGYLTLWANYRLGGLERTGYHIANLAIHVINTVLVYFIVILTFRTPLLKSSRLKESSGKVALFAGILFAVHPIQTEAVTYILQRFVLLAAMFYLLSAAAYIASRLSERRTRRYMLYALALVSAVLGMKTKENVFTLPLMLALYEFIFFRESLKQRTLALVPFLLTMSIIPLTYIKRYLEQNNLASAMESATRVDDIVPRSDYLLSQFGVVLSYIKLLILPVNQSLIHSPDVHVSLLEPAVFGSLLILLAIIGFGISLHMRAKNGDPACRLFSFGIFWFFLALSVESSILPISILMTEYRVYLPSAGAFFAISVGTFLMYEKLATLNMRSAFTAMLLILPLALAGATYARNNLWTDKEKMWLDVIEKSPRTPEGYLSVGGFYSLGGRYDDAIRYLEAGLRIKSLSSYHTLSKSETANAHYNLGLAYHKRGDLMTAIKQYESSLSLSPFNKITHYSLAEAYNDVGMKKEAINHLLDALELDPNYFNARINLALIYISQGEMQLARRELEEVLLLDGSNARARQFLDYLEKQQAR